MRYNKGDWVKYRHHEGWIADGKVLEVRPDGDLVIGDHDKDPNPDHINQDSIVGMVRND